MEPVHVSTGVLVRELTPYGDRVMVAPPKFTVSPLNRCVSPLTTIK